MAMPMRGGIITCDIRDVPTLYKSYLPFIAGGALFVPNDRISALGEDVFVAFTLPSQSDRYPLNGKVAWINHKASANRPAGFAIQFGSDANGTRLRNEIEKLLAGQLDGAQATYTL
ncbi:MAG: pilus assembly protein PilZ [Moraxella sp.]|nr:pilus assembly protein PilZ [Moraxella sp.]